MSDSAVEIRPLTPAIRAAACERIACGRMQGLLAYRGGATALLDAPCAQLREQGLLIAEATPRPQAKSDAEQHYGPLALYLAAGFEKHREEPDGTVIVRRRLA